MTATTLQLDLDLAPSRPPMRFGDPAPTKAAALALQRRTPSGPAPGPAGGRLTLDETLVGVWEGLLARRTVRCPVCHAEAMAPSGGGGRCGACRSELT